MKTVHADVTAALSMDSAEEVVWYIDIIPLDSATTVSPADSDHPLYPGPSPQTFRISTGAIPDDANTPISNVYNNEGHTYGELLNKSIKWKKTSKQEWDKISIGINICDSGATNDVVRDLLIEFGAGSLDQAKVVFGVYTDLHLVPLEECRVFKVGLTDTTLNLTLTNELHEFRGKFPKTRHEPQVWNRVEDTFNKSIDGNVWEQSDTLSNDPDPASEVEQGRYRKGTKITDYDRQGFSLQWRHGEETVDRPFVYPWAYGQKIIATIPSTRYGPFILTEGAAGGWYTVMNVHGDQISGGVSLKPLTELADDFGDPREDIYDNEAFITSYSDAFNTVFYEPVYSAMANSLTGTGIPQTQFVVFDGRMHWSYNASGEKQTFASAHGTPGSLNTNPIWVIVDVLMNGLGLTHDKIDWDTAYEVATELETANYDLRFILKDPEEIVDVLDKIALNGSFFWRWAYNAAGEGAVHFDRRRPSDDAVFIAKGGTDGWFLDFSDVDNQIDTFNFTDQSIETTPNKFNVKFLSQGQDDDDRFFHRILEHLMEIQDKVYIKENAMSVDMDWLYDSLGFSDDGVGNASLPLLETLKTIRMKRVQARFRVKTLNLNAILLDGADPVRITHSLNSLDVTSQECEVESVQFDGKDAATLILKPREDDWFSGDIHASVNTEINWSDTGTQEGNVPSYRYALETAQTTGTTFVYLNSFAGTDDPRALAPGNTLWAAHNTYPTADWGHKSNSVGADIHWRFLGDIDAVEYEATRIKVTLRTNALYAANVSNRVQCQPNVTHTSVIRSTDGGSDADHYEIRARLNFTEEWDFAVGSIDGETSTNGGTVFVDKEFSWVDGIEYMETTVDVGVFSSKYTSDAFPGVVGFKLRTFNGVTGTETVYVFSVSDVSITETTFTDAEINLLDLPFSDFTEQGVLVQTDWDSALNPNVTFKIEYDVAASWGSADGWVYGWTGADPATDSPEPAFKELLITEGVTDAGTTAVFNLRDHEGADINFGDEITLRLTTYESDGTTPVGSVSDLTLTKTNRQFENYFGSVNKYAGNIGSGMLMATTGFGLFHSTWTKDSGGFNDYAEWAGGLYIYDKDPDQTVTPDPTINRWTRYGKVPDASPAQYVSSGPSFAVETTGETKISYFNKDITNPGIGVFFEAGCLFYTFPDEVTREDLRGEFLIGLGKTLGLSTALTPLEYDVPNDKYDMTGLASARVNTTTTDYTTFRGAPFSVLRSSTYGDARFSPKVLARDLAVSGLLIGEGVFLTQPESPTNDTSFMMYTFNGTDFDAPHEANFLGGAVESTTNELQWIAFPYTTSGATGLKIPSLGASNRISGSARRLPITVKMFGDTTPGAYYTSLSKTNGWAQMPCITESDETSWGRFRLDADGAKSFIEVVQAEGTEKYYPMYYDVTTLNFTTSTASFVSVAQTFNFTPAYTNTYSYSATLDTREIQGWCTDGVNDYPGYFRITSRGSGSIQISLTPHGSATAWKFNSSTAAVIINVVGY